MACSREDVCHPPTPITTGLAHCWPGTARSGRSRRWTGAGRSRSRRRWPRSTNGSGRSTCPSRRTATTTSCRRWPGCGTTKPGIAGTATRASRSTVGTTRGWSSATAAGDPFIFDRATGRVLADTHGRGRWDPGERFADLPTMAAALGTLGSVVVAAGDDFTDDDCYIRPAHRARAVMELAAVLGDRQAAENLVATGRVGLTGTSRRGRRPTGGAGPGLGGTSDAGLAGRLGTLCANDWLARR